VLHWSLLWDASRHAVLARLRVSAAPVVALDISAIRHHLAAADEKSEAAIWGWR